MEYQIGNKDLMLTVSDMGAEMISIKYQQKEYLWQGDKKYWMDHAPNLFPYVGRFTNGIYTFKGKEYHMDIHGFAKDSIFQVMDKSSSGISFILKDTPKTYVIYPFHFSFIVNYSISANKIKIKYQIKNQSNEIMYFGVGGHPGFCVPMDDDCSFNDYYLKFETKIRPNRVGHTDDCFLNGSDKEYSLKDNDTIPLCHEMFDDDAIVLSNMADTVTLKADQGRRSVTLSYPQMHFLGIWHAPHTNAPYVCIEPWTSLPSRKGIVEDISCKSDLICINGREEYNNEWSISLE